MSDRVRPVAAATDGALLRALHDEHGPALWSYVVQETFLRAWRNPAILNRPSPRAWLFTVAKRIVIDEWRSSRHRRERVTDTLPEQPVPDATDHAVDRHVVLAALRTLSPEHRAVLHETYFRGASVNEASRALGIAPGTVKSRTHYALRALRVALDELGGVS